MPRAQGLCALPPTPTYQPWLPASWRTGTLSPARNTCSVREGLSGVSHLSGDPCPKVVVPSSWNGRGGWGHMGLHDKITESLQRKEILPNRKKTL